MISVIIPHRDRPERLALCLWALERTEVHGYEIIVVDQSSKNLSQVVSICRNRGGRGKNRACETRLVVGRESPIVTLTDEKRHRVFNKPMAINDGISAAYGTTLTFLDCDSVPCKDFMRHAAWLNSSKGAQSGITRLCYRVRHLPPNVPWQPVEGCGELVDSAYEKYDEYPISFEGYVAPEIDGKLYDDTLPEHIFGNSQFSIRRDKLGDTRCDEAYVGAGWEDLAFIAQIHRDARGSYKGKMIDQALFHVRNVRDPLSWSPACLNRDNHDRYVETFGGYKVS